MQKTFKGAAGQGYVIDLGEVVTSISIMNRVECAVKPAYADTVPDSGSAPTSAAIPSVDGTSTDYTHLIAAGEELELSANDGQLSKTAEKPVRFNHVLVYFVAAGELSISGV